MLSGRAVLRSLGGSGEGNGGDGFEKGLLSR
jgi:hypothetical protein